MPPDARTRFLHESIADSQGTIRALDVKAGFLLAFLGLPIASLERVVAVLRAVLLEVDASSALILLWIAAVAFALAWILALLAALRSLMPLSDPEHLVKRVGKATGVFHSGGLLSMRIWDAFVNRQSLRCSVTVDQQLERLPDSDDSVSLELTLEQLKLACIRDIKIHRQRMAFALTLVWLSSGALLWIAKLLICA